MPDLAASGASCALCFADGVAGHIVLVHITLLGLFADAVKKLSVAERTEGCEGHDLSLTACEYRASVNAVHKSDLCRERADLIHAASVNALSVVEEPAADYILLDLVEDLIEHDMGCGVSAVKLVINLLVDGSHSLIADVLVVCVERDADIVDDKRLDLLIEIVVNLA